MITWLDYREQIRRAILKDDDPDPKKWRWPDYALRDLVGWAMDAFCAHTAVATATSFAATEAVYTLPDNLYDGDMDSIMAYYISNSGTTPSYLTPVSTPSRALTPNEGEFSVWPKDTLRIHEAPGEGYTLYVYYFAYYDHPVEDTDMVQLPQWAHMAVGYLVASAAMTSPFIRSSNIKQWDERGNQELNALRSAQKWFLELYETEITRVQRQNRSMYWTKHR